MQLQFQKINYARRNAITTPEDKLYAEERDYAPQKMNYACRNVITTPEDKLCAEERQYDSKR